MEVPKPTTLRRLWTYVHEAVHLGSTISSVLTGNNYLTSEAEAELGALRIFEAERLTPSLRHLRATRRRIEYEAEKDKKEFGRSTRRWSGSVSASSTGGSPPRWKCKNLCKRGRKERSPGESGTA
jgi:hypothetical protein